MKFEPTEEQRRAANAFVARHGEQNEVIDSGGQARLEWSPTHTANDVARFLAEREALAMCKGAAIAWGTVWDSSAPADVIKAAENVKGLHHRIDTTEPTKEQKQAARDVCSRQLIGVPDSQMATVDDVASLLARVEAERDAARAEASDLKGALKVTRAHIAELMADRQRQHAALRQRVHRRRPAQPSRALPHQKGGASMTMTTVTTAQMVCDECGGRGPEFTRGDRSKQAAREFARAAGWKHCKRETPRNTIWVDVCADCWYGSKRREVATAPRLARKVGDASQPPDSTARPDLAAINNNGGTDAAPT